MGGLGVLLAAFGEHALSGRLAPRALSAFTTAAHYQMIHALAMGLATLTARGAAASAARLSALLFLTGTLLFSGSLYALALTGVAALGFVTPLGGLVLVAGWIALAAAALKRQDT